MAGDSCLYGETYALRMVRQRYLDSERAQQAAQYYLGGGPALTGPQILQRVFNVNVTALQAYQSDPEVSQFLCCAPQLSLPPFEYIYFVWTGSDWPALRGTRPCGWTAASFSDCRPTRGALMLVSTTV